MATVTEGVRVRSVVQRLRLPDWRAAAWSGVIAGIACLLLQMAFQVGGNVWEPMRTLAQVLITDTGFLPMPGTVNSSLVLAALTIICVLGIEYSALLADIVYYRSVASAIAIGAAFGLALYFFNFYALSGVFPWVVESRNGVTVINHVLFGIIAAGIYKALEQETYKYSHNRPAARVG